MKNDAELKALIEKLRTRAAIRRKATCRGPDDRLANDLDEAANELEKLLPQQEPKSGFLPNGCVVPGFFE